MGLFVTNIPQMPKPLEWNYCTPSPKKFKFKFEGMFYDNFFHKFF